MKQVNTYNYLFKQLDKIKIDGKEIELSCSGSQSTKSKYLYLAIKDELDNEMTFNIKISDHVIIKNYKSERVNLKNEYMTNIDQNYMNLSTGTQFGGLNHLVLSLKISKDIIDRIINDIKWFLKLKHTMIDADELMGWISRDFILEQIQREITRN